MADLGKKALAFIVVVLLTMVMLVPVIPDVFALENWLVTLFVAAVIVPVVVFIAHLYARDKTEDADPEYMTWRGQTEEEWTEREDPDDFEGEID
jgi:heme/copper-type cytochrome/quinol oxidase subunit 4